jgi:tetratricopeptide (TPR) repeat protein
MIIGGAIVVLLLVCGLAAKPVYHWLKARRANQFAAQAEVFVQEGKLNDAAAKYRAALQMDPLGYRALAGAARLATRGGRPEAVDLWQQVMRLPERTLQDRQEYAALLVQRGMKGPAAKMVEDLLRAAPDQKTLALAVQFYSKEGNDEKALELARRAVTQAPDDDALRFKLAELLAKSSDAARRNEAREILWALAGKSGRFQKPALEALARAPELSGEEKQRTLHALEALPDANAVTGLLGAELKLQLQPEQAEQIYSDMIARWGQGEVADVAELTRWLNLHQQPERVLTLLPADRAVTAEPLLLSRLDALGSLNRWTEVDKLLQRPDLGLDPAVTESFHARSMMGANVRLEADVHWERAITFAKDDPYKLRFVANFAEQSSATAPALKAYDLLSRFPEQAAFAQRGKQRLLEKTGDTMAARAVAEQLLKLAPDDVNAEGQLIHLSLLLGQDVDANFEKAKALADKYPARLSFRVTAALGFLRKHDAGGALAEFEAPVPIEWERTPPGWRAVYAAVLAANDQNDAARDIMKTVPPERLSKEERALVAAVPTAP